MSDQHDAVGRRLPIKLDTTTNGEYAPIPLEPVNCMANTMAQDAADRAHKRLNMNRRRFMTTSCGAASALLAINAANASTGNKAGFFAVSDESRFDAQLASAELGKKEFIFDVQGHYLPPSKAATVKSACAKGSEVLSREYMRCIGADGFIKDVFLDSDTDMMVLSFVPSRRDAEPLTIEEADATRRIVDELEGDHRLLIHGRVNPNQDGDLDGMDELAEKYGVSAWKTYTQWGPDGKGFFMTDDVGIAMVERARKLGVKNICIHKGIPFGRQSYEHSTCQDIGPIAKQYPDINFLIYHSGWVPGQAEGPLDSDRVDGIDGLINSVRNAGLGHGSNVYAELGSTWRGLMRDMDSAAHGIGKLVKCLGEDNVVWGSDSVWYGSPQDQIQAFRAFQIDKDIADEHGYSQITPEVRAKILGLNALKPYGISMEEAMMRAGGDVVSARRENYRGQENPHYLTFGPKTRRDFLRLFNLQGGDLT